MSYRPDLLLVNVGGTRKKVYQNLSEDLAAIEPPFWAALTADYVRRNGYEVLILDANAENMDIYETANAIGSINPKLTNIVVYGQHPSASTPLMDGVGKLCREIKRGDASLEIILTGLHPSALPKRTMREEKCDYVGEGEGFYTLLGLLSNHDPRQIPGLWFREGNEINKGPMSKNVTNLDEELSSVAWDLLPMDKYRAHNWHCLNDLNSRESYGALSTSLGCPFKCVFCCINTPFEKPGYREWSSEWTIKQIDNLVENYGVKNLKIIDELFVLKPEHLLGVADKIIERGHKLNIWAYSRIDTAKEKYLDRLKRAGFNRLGIGIESGVNEIRKEAQKGKFQDEQIIEVVKRIKSFDINIGANYIFGLPHDTIKSMQETLDLAIELNCEWANFYSAMAYPGSALHRQSLEKGIILPEDGSGPGCIGYSQHSYETLPLPTETLSPSQVLKFRDEAFNKYFTNPRYLNRVNEKFGPKAREHIENMTKRNLKRKILGDKL